MAAENNLAIVEGWQLGTQSVQCNRAGIVEITTQAEKLPSFPRNVGQMSYLLQLI
jgi:hypothetical protein